jgi:hypothetical protein
MIATNMMMRMLDLMPDAVVNADFQHKEPCLLEGSG